MNESNYYHPTVDLLNSAVIPSIIDFEKLEEQQKHIIDVLRTFCIPINEIKYTLGPSVVRYEIKPKSGQLYAKVRKNEHDIALCISPMGGCSDNIARPWKECHSNRNGKSDTKYAVTKRCYRV